MLVLLILSLGSAQPGRTVDLELRETLSVGEVGGLTNGLFRGDDVEPPPVRTAVLSYLLRFETRDASGDPVEALAQLFVPEEPVDAGSLLALAAGSSGLVDHCAPSAGYVRNGNLRSDWSYVRYALAYAGQGLPTVVPNYIGFFDPERIQPYFVAEAEAHVVLDAIRAAGEVLGDIDDALVPSHAFAAGYSQGGHAAFAAADRLATYASDVPLAGVLGFGPSGEVDVVMRAFPYVAPWILVAYAEVYDGAVDPMALLQEPYASRLAEDVERQCIDAAQVGYPGDPRALFVPELAAALEQGTLADAYPALHELVETNRTGVEAHGLPAVIFQGSNDPVVPLADQHRYVARLCDLGSPVRYPNFLERRHETRYVGFEAALAWMRARVLGEAAPSDCEDVPRQ